MRISWYTWRKNYRKIQMNPQRKKTIPTTTTIKMSFSHRNIKTKSNNSHRSISTESREKNFWWSNTSSSVPTPSRNALSSRTKSVKPWRERTFWWITASTNGSQSTLPSSTTNSEEISPIITQSTRAKAPTESSNLKWTQDRKSIAIKICQTPI